MYTKKKPGKERSFNSDLIKLLKDIDIAPIIISIKDCVVIAQFLTDESYGMFDQNSMVELV